MLAATLLARCHPIFTLTHNPNPHPYLTQLTHIPNPHPLQLPEAVLEATLLGPAASEAARQQAARVGAPPGVTLPLRSGAALAAYVLRPAPNQPPIANVIITHNVRGRGPSCVCYLGGVLILYGLRPAPDHPPIANVISTRIVTATGVRGCLGTCWWELVYVCVWWMGATSQTPTSKLL